MFGDGVKYRKVFTGNQANATVPNSWYEWLKPVGITMVHIFCLGGGSGGSSVINGGTAGGGSGGVATILLNADALPAVLWVQPGAGAPADTVSNRSFVAVSPTTAAANCLIASSAAPANNVTGPAVSTTVTHCYLGLSGIFSSVAGVSGGSNTASTTSLSSSIVTGGAGGASATVVAGTSTFTNSLYPSGISDGTNGANGVWLWSPLCGVGGGGGGTAGSTGVATGGTGAFGCGGGGSYSSNSSAVGGAGGPGLVIVSAW